MKKKILSLLLAIVMLCGMMPATAMAAATDCTVTNNVIDITDASLLNAAAVNVTEITVSGADVVGATEDGTTINVTLAAGTSPTAEVSAVFTFKVIRPGMGTPTTTQSVTSCTLVGGAGTMTTTVTATSGLSGSKTYTINFTSLGGGATEPAEPIIVFMSYMDEGAIVKGGDADGTLLYQVPVVVTDANEDGEITVGEAFLALHEGYYADYTESAPGYAETSTETVSGWVTEFWGKNGKFSYAVNYGWAHSTLDVLENADYVTAYYNQDAEYSDFLTWFDGYDSEDFATEAGTDKTFTVKGISIFKSGKVNGEIINVTGAPVGATVKVYDIDGEEVADLATTTDAEGKVSITFPAAGEYTVEVSGTCSYTYNGVTTSNVPVQPARCIVTVTGDAAEDEPAEPVTIPTGVCSGYKIDFAVTGATVTQATTTPSGNNGTLDLVVTDVTGDVVVTPAVKDATVQILGITPNPLGLDVSSGSAKGTFTLMVMQGGPRPGGAWTVNVTVSGGAEEEEPVTLSITTDLSEDEVKYFVGDTASALTVEAVQSRGEAVSYQWYKNSTKSTEGAVAIEDATSASYTPATTAAGTTYYYAVATCGDLSATSEIAAVVVEEAKEIILSATSEYYTITFEVEGATVVSAQPTVSGYGGTLQLDVKDVTTADNKIKVTPTVTGGSYDTDVYYVTLNLSSGSGENSFEIWDVAAGFPTNKVGEWKIKAVVVDETNPATVSFTKDLSEDEVKYVVGKTASALTVKAVQSRGEAVSYQWYKNSSKSTEGAVAIEDATSASYTPATTAAGTTYYYAVATSGELTATSKIAMITVEEPTLTITTDLSEDEVKYFVGDTASALTVEAAQSKGESVSYQWYKNSTKSTEGAAAIEGANSASYTPDTTAAGTTYYYAVATSGELTATSKIAMITVEEMEKAPQVTFSVSANNQLIIGKDADQTLMGNVSTSFEDIKASAASMMWNYFGSYINEENTTALELILHALKLYYNGGQDVVPNDLYYFDGDNIGLPLGYTESDSDWDGINDTIILEDLWGYGNAQGMNYPAAIEIFVNGAPQVVYDLNSMMPITTSPNKIVLNAGDHVDIAIFPFYDSVSATYLRYFADSEGKFGNAFSVNSGEDLSLQALQTFCDKYGGVYGGPGETYVEPNPTGYVYYGLSPFSADASQIDTDMTTGGFTLTKENLHTPGTWYVWMQDEPGMGTLSHPALAMITVVAGEEEPEEPAEPGVLDLGIATSNGSVNSVKFTDEGGNAIEGLTAVLEDTIIKVSVPRSVGPTGKIMATFDLTQNSDGLPFLTTKTGASGTSSGKAVNNKFTAKTTTLSGGEAVFTFYLYNSVPKVVSNYYTTYKINYAMANKAPELTGAAAKSDTGVAGTAYELNVPALFTDPDGDELTYKVSVNGAAAVAAELNENGIYSYTTLDAGTHTLVFTAHDAYNGVSEPYTLTLEIANSQTTYDVAVTVPAGVTPTFYYTADAEEGTALEAAAANNVYTVKVPENVSTIAWRYDDMGMSAAVSTENNALTLVKTHYVIMVGDNIDTGAVVTVKTGDVTAVGKNNTFLLLESAEYTVSVKAGPDYTATWKDATFENEIATNGDIVLELEAKEIPITVPYFAELTIRAATTRQGIPNGVIEPVRVGTPDYASGTRTDYYLLTNGTVYEYRVSVPEDHVNRDDYVTLVGMFKKSDATNITVTKEQIEDGTNGRKTIDHVLEPYTNGSLDSANVADLYMNVNAQGYLKMTQGATKDLYTARTWWATNGGGWSLKTYYFMEPDYDYTVVGLDGQPSNDVVTVDDNGKITAVGNGTAIVLVTYDAMNSAIDDALFRESGPEEPDENGFYSAIWPENTGVFVVSVGAGDSGITTGMTINENKILTDKAAGKSIDAEHDVIYFIGNQGTYTFTPGTEGVTVSVANPSISGNVLSFSGFTTLTAKADGSYDVPLTNGRNIVRVEKNGAAEYQVITAKSVNVTVNGLPLDKAVVAPGDEVSIVFDTLYTPVNRLCIYNTGAAVVYGEVSGWEGKTAGNHRGGMGFYFFASNAAHQTVAHFNNTGTDGSAYGNNAVTTGDKLTVPEDFNEPWFTLSDGAFSVGGFSKFNFGDHRTVMGQAPSSGGANNVIAFFGQLPDISIRTTVEVAALESIAVTTQPTKTEYFVGEAFNPAGMVVTATYSDGSSKAVTGYICSPTTFSEAGAQTVTVTYTEDGIIKQTTVRVTVGKAVVVLERIAITTQPTKKIYKIGEAFDPTGMVVTATYSDGSSKAVTGYTCTPAPLGKTDTTVTVVYTEDGVTKTASVSITMNLVKRIAVTTLPTKTTYYEGEVFVPYGMVVTATYVDGTEVETEDYRYVPTAALTAANTIVVITYAGEDGASNLRATTLSITVEKAPEELPAYDSITVYMSYMVDGKVVNGKDGTDLYNVAVTVYDDDQNGKYTLGDAFEALHMAYYSGGADGYQDDGNLVSNFWNAGMAGLSYVVNHGWVNGIAVEVKSGDKIAAYRHQDESGNFSDLYTWFAQDLYIATTAEAKSFTVNGMNVMASHGGYTATANPVGATVTAYNANGQKVAALSTVTDASGQFSITFPDAGIYMIEVNGTCDYTLANGFVVTDAPVVPCRCTVFVPAAGTEGPGTGEPGTEEPGVTKFSFIDVNKSDYFYDAVVWAVENAITTGTTPFTFSPAETCTRAQMVTFLWRAAGCPNPAIRVCAFEDVDRNAYYYEALLWAVGEGITTGTSATTFSPDAPCTRAQMVTFLYRMEGCPAAYGSHGFKDVFTDAYYEDAVVWAVRMGVTTGVGDNRFAPGAICTRAQMVTFLYNLLG